MVTGLDLVRQQIRSAQGGVLEISQEDVRADGHAIEVRITSESPEDNFMPRTGTLKTWTEPKGPHIRIDTHAETGYIVGPYYDSLLAKLITHGGNRAEASSRMLDALDALKVEGVPTTAHFAAFVVAHPDFRSAQVTTDWIMQRGLPEYMEITS